MDADRLCLNVPWLRKGVNGQCMGMCNGVLEGNHFYDFFPDDKHYSKQLHAARYILEEHEECSIGTCKGHCYQEEWSKMFLVSQSFF